MAMIIFFVLSLFASPSWSSDPEGGESGTWYFSKSKDAFGDEAAFGVYTYSFVKGGVFTLICSRDGLGGGVDDAGVTLELGERFEADETGNVKVKMIRRPVDDEA